jgi:Ca2+-transporting ATPase
VDRRAGTDPGSGRVGSRPESDTAASVAAAYRVDLQRGLTPSEAGERIHRFGPNELPRARQPGLVLSFLTQLWEPMSLLLVAAALVAAFGLGEWLDGAAIVAIVLLNAVIATVQESRAEQALDALRAMEAPTTRVLRDGRVVAVPARALVPGDVVLVASGDRVPADLRLTEASALDIDESLLTGESLPVTKQTSPVVPAILPLGDRRSMAFTGSLVVRGSGAGIVVATGSATELGAIAARLTGPSLPTPLQHELRRLTGVLGTAAVVVALVVFGLTLAREGADHLEEAFLSAVALAVAAVPEGLATVVTVALALGVRRMAQQGAIVRTLPAVETLGSTDVILTDKTGTLTENRMRLETLLTGIPPAAAVAGSSASRAFDVAVLCNDAALDPRSGDPLEIALLEAAGVDRIFEIRARLPRLGVAPFDPARKRMSTLHQDGEGYVLMVKGAPEEVVARSAWILDANGAQRPLDEDARSMLLDAVAAAAERGMRTLALARKELDDAPDELAREEQDLTMIGLAALRDPARPDAAAAVGEARSAGIRIVMVTGDHPGTALAIAREVGIADSEDRAVWGTELKQATAEDPLAAPVFARAEPEDKLHLVKLLQSQGHVVAVTGDGVNDAPALHRADVGVAMGRSGTQVAREAADIVVTDDNLSTIVLAVREGRAIYDNVRNVVEYLVTANLSEILVVLCGLLLFPGLGVPLLPLQLLWINLVTDGLPAVGLGLDPVGSDVMRRGPRPRGSRLLHGRGFVGLGVAAALLAAASLGSLAVSRMAWEASWEQAQGVMFSVLALSQLFYAFAIRQVPVGAGRGVWSAARRLTGNRWLLAGVVGGVALQCGLMLWAPARALFGTAVLAPREWALVFGAALLPAVLVHLGRRRRSGGRFPDVGAKRSSSGPSREELSRDGLARLQEEHAPEAIRSRLAATPAVSYLRDFVYGAVDGTVTTFAVVAGAAGARLSATVVIVLGAANLIADGFSMAISNFLGSRADQQLENRRRREEERHIELVPEGEREEIRQLLARKGFRGGDLDRATEVLTSNPAVWVETMLREEHGFSGAPRQPHRAALATFAAFVLVGFLPLAPFAYQLAAPGHGGSPFGWSALATGVAFFGTGAVKSRFVEERWWVEGLRTLLLGGAAAALAYAVGGLLHSVAA